MKIYFKSLWARILSKDTWERIRELNTFKSYKEGLKPISKDDILPVTISIVIGILMLAIGIPACRMILNWIKP